MNTDSSEDNSTQSEKLSYSQTVSDQIAKRPMGMRALFLPRTKYPARPAVTPYLEPL